MRTTATKKDPESTDTLKKNVYLTELMKRADQKPPPTPPEMKNNSRFPPYCPT